MLFEIVFRKHAFVLWKIALQFRRHKNFGKERTAVKNFRQLGSAIWQLKTGDIVSRSEFCYSLSREKKGRKYLENNN